MKLAVLILGVTLLVACDTPPAQTGPKPNVAPARVSNENTRKHIEVIGVKHRESLEKSKEGDKHLQSAEEALKELLK